MSNPIENKLVIQIATKDADGNPAWADLLGQKPYKLTEVQRAFAALDKLAEEAPVNEYRLVNVKVDLLAIRQKQEVL